MSDWLVDCLALGQYFAKVFAAALMPSLLGMLVYRELTS